MMGNSGFEIDESDDSVQSLAPPSQLDRFEGIAFSSSGNIIGVAASDTHTVYLYRRKANGRFEDTPYCSIGGSGSALNYPHDVAFSLSGDTELLAVAQRQGAIAVYEKNRADDTYGPDPVFVIRGPKTKLNLSDGVAFVPPDNDFLAACNLETGSITFYRRISLSPIGFGLKPAFELKHPSLSSPDGLGFTRCGRWLAVANHGNHSVSIYQRRKAFFTAGGFKYGPEPVTTIKDAGMRYAHSVAFTPATNHLVVTNAGANHFGVYEPTGHDSEMRWSQSPTLQKTVGRDSIFRDVNERNKMEGGPKGVAVHQNSLAICGSEYGIKIYSFRERAAAR